ncbi:class E sortase [Janibacter terrae]|uniref:class E sortase n=1 Tax=Janibacter terrae TaxID=103817 RepID=UPI0031F879C0
MSDQRSSGRVRADALGVLGELVITAGVLVLLFVGWQLWWTDVTAEREQAHVVDQLERRFADGPAARRGGAHPETDEGGAEVASGADADAILRIPRFGSDYARPIYSGTDEGTLRRGVGHYPRTAEPGAVGNFALAGHRTTYGRPFSDVERLVVGDRVLVETAREYHVYRVTSSTIVDPSESSVIAPVPGRVGSVPTEARLTLTTCHPRYSARQRYIVHADLVHTYPRAAGLPPEVLAAPTQEA